MKRGDQLKFGVFIMPYGHQAASWRHPDVVADAPVNFDYFVDLARIAERGKLDMFFLADGVSVRMARPEVMARSAQYIAGFEPISLISALAGVTQRLGLVATASTSYNEPYHVARKFASVDLLSGGRTGWNIVTSASESEARNFNRESHFPHAERYERAREFTRVVLDLWDSWEDDAFPRDKVAGLYSDPAKLHALHHKGKFFSVEGPLNVPRSPQGYPVLVQAGASDDGRGLAAEFAEAMFSNSLTIESAQVFYADMKRRAVDCGRNPDHIKILPGLSAIIGRSEQEAEEKFEYLQSLTDPIVAREVLSHVLGGADLSRFPFDGPLPQDLPRSETIGTQSGYANWMNLAKQENLSIRQLAYRAVGARGKVVIRGTPVQIADHIEQWFTGHACDGFNLMPATLPGGLVDFVDLVVPELQRRGLFRKDYEGTTLRDHLGLPCPENRYTSARRRGAA